MSSSLMKLTYMGFVSVVRRAAHLFTTQRKPSRCATSLAALPRKCAALFSHLGSNFGSVALGGFYLVHELSVIFLPFFVTPKHP